MKKTALLFILWLTTLVPFIAPDLVRGHVWASEIEEDLEEELKNEIENELEDEIEDELEDEIENELEDEIEDELEDEIEDELEDEIEDELEDEIEDELEDEIEDELEDEIEDELEDEIEDELEDEIEDELEDEIEDELEDEIEDELEDEIEDELEDEIEDEVEDELEDEVEEELEDEVEDELEDEVEDELEDEQEEEFDEDEEDEFERKKDPELVSYNDSEDNNRTAKEQVSGSSSKLTPRELILDRDEFDNEFEGNDWVILASTEEIKALSDKGLVPRDAEVMSGLDLVLARFSLPDKTRRTQAKADLQQVAKAVDFNHTYRRFGESQPTDTYRPEINITHEEVLGVLPTELYDLPAEQDGEGLAIGIIDTQINTEHRALTGANVRAHSFVSDLDSQPLDHGTSVASIIVGQSAEYQGLLPKAEIYSASVFSQTDDRGTTATTISLVRALDWMTENSVRVVNMSLTGPPNTVLKQAIDRAFEGGTVVVAAVGNAGPTAEPLYPAAYQNVVAVTAIGQQRQVYRLANRGGHLDFAAPGINVQHAQQNMDFASSSGTSMAAPFVAAILAVYGDPELGITPELLDKLANNAEDLGQEGFDHVYGHGLIRPLTD